MEDEAQKYSSPDELTISACLTLQPPPKFTVSEFADKHIVLTSGPLAGSRWRTDFMPYQRAILDAFFEPGIEYVVLQASSQVGKTSAAVVLVAYHIAHDPCTILVVEPTVDPMARDFSKNRLDPVINASSILADSVSKKREKDSSNTIASKTFRGGSLSIGGANSAASLAARTIRLLILDEIDRYPPELPGEGSTLSIAMKRTSAFGKRQRVLLLSSPTLRDAPIDSWFQRGDQRRYHVPCPKCGYMHPYKWKNIHFKDKDPSTARLHCPDCDYPVGDAERIEALDRGEWRPDNPNRREKNITSLHLWEAYSPLSSLSTIVSGFLAANEAKKRGDHSLMHTWQNTCLGEAIDPGVGEAVKSSVLMDRRESYAAPAPAKVCCITMGVDVQEDRLEALVVGWAPEEESFLIDRQMLEGDTSRPDVWDELDRLLDKTYAHETGVRLGIMASCVDAGYRTDYVYDYVSKKVSRQVYAIIGRAGGGPISSSPSRKKRGKSRTKIALYTLGVDAAKAMWVSRYRVTKKGPGYVHIPLEPWADKEMAEQLTAEVQVKKKLKGFPVLEWVPIRARNEMFDCAVYSLGALRILHPDLQGLADRLNDTLPPPVVQTPKKEPWLGSRRKKGGWLK